MINYDKTTKFDEWLRCRSPVINIYINKAVVLLLLLWSSDNFYLDQLIHKKQNKQWLD